MNDLYQRLNLSGQTDDRGAIREAIMDCADPEVAARAEYVLLDDDRKAVYDRSRDVLRTIGRLRANLGVDWQIEEADRFQDFVVQPAAQSRAFSEPRPTMHVSHPSTRDGAAYGMGRAVRKWFESAPVGASMLIGTVLASILLYFGYLLFSDPDTEELARSTTTPNKERPVDKPVHRTVERRPYTSESLTNRPTPRRNPTFETPHFDPSQFQLQPKLPAARPEPKDRFRTVTPPIKAEPLPFNGKAWRYHATTAVAPFKIVTRSGSGNYYAKLVDYFDKDKIVVAMFIRDGQSVNLKVPLGTFQLRYAVGESWYGKEKLFGPGTRRAIAASEFSKKPEEFSFTSFGNQIRGYTVELYFQPGGNLDSIPVSEEEF